MPQVALSREEAPAVRASALACLASAVAHATAMKEMLQPDDTSMQAPARHCLPGSPRSAVVQVLDSLPGLLQVRAPLGSHE